MYPCCLLLLPSLVSAAFLAASSSFVSASCALNDSARASAPSSCGPHSILASQM